MQRAETLVTGFREDAALVADIARRLKLRSSLATESTRQGRSVVQGPTSSAARVLVVANLREDPGSLFRILNLAEAVRANGAEEIGLLAPWIAYGSQDRASKPGEAPTGIAIATALSHAFHRITTLDAHSDAFIRAFHGRLINVLPPIDAKMVLPFKNIDLIAAPDRGAETRAKQAARRLGLPLIVMEKKRSGARVSTQLASGSSVPPGVRVLLVDDIGDGGTTLIQAAKTLTLAGAKSVCGLVTHTRDLNVLRKATSKDLEKVIAVFDHAKNMLDSRGIDVLLDSDSR